MFKLSRQRPPSARGELPPSLVQQPPTQSLEFLPARSLWSPNPAHTGVCCSWALLGYRRHHRSSAGSPHSLVHNTGGEHTQLSNKMHPLLQRALFLAKQGWYVLAATILMTSQPFITSLSKNGEGGYDYLPVSTTFVVEISKLFISVTFYLLLPANAKSHRALRGKDALLFAIPAFVYFVNNNLIFIILKYVNSTTYQILSSLKTVFTGILFRVVLKRVLSDVQATAILLLACGAAVSQFPICPSVCNEEGEEVSMFSAAGAWLGAIVALLACLLSAFGGVYSELLLKKDGKLHSIHLQNMVRTRTRARERERARAQPTQPFITRLCVSYMLHRLLMLLTPLSRASR